jgi:hypothetical protein
MSISSISGSITSSSHSSGTGSSVKHRRTPSDVPQTGAIVRTESPDNDSAFSDSLSLLSSESSASSGARTMAQQVRAETMYFYIKRGMVTFIYFNYLALLRTGFILRHRQPLYCELQANVKESFIKHAAFLLFF